MKTNHIFIFCDNHDEVATELIKFGFTEGSNRIHPNQGTRNRKFYFNDFYIEIIWVHNVDEARNNITAPTKLYERSKYKTNEYSQFGLCVDYLEDDNKLFENCFIYKPTYLPENLSIEVLKNEKAKTLPWTFRLNTALPSTKIDEPINLKNQNLLQVVFGVDKTKVDNNYLNLFQSDIIVFQDSKSEFLKLTFDTKNSKTTKVFNTVPLIIKY